MTETEIKEKNKQIPIALKLTKDWESYYVVRDLEKYYFNTIWWKDIFINPDLNINYRINYDWTISVKWVLEDNAIYKLENDLFPDPTISKGLNIDRYKKYIKIIKNPQIESEVLELFKKSYTLNDFLNVISWCSKKFEKKYILDRIDQKYKKYLEEIYKKEEEKVRAWKENKKNQIKKLWSEILELRNDNWNLANIEKDLKEQFDKELKIFLSEDWDFFQFLENNFYDFLAKYEHKEYEVIIKDKNFVDILAKLKKYLKGFILEDDYIDDIIEKVKEKIKNNLDGIKYFNYEEIKNIKKDLLFLPIEHWSKFDKLSKVSFQDWSFYQKNYSIYEFEETFREIIPEIITTSDYKISYITLDKINHPFIFWNNTKNNENLFKKDNEKKSEKFDKINSEKIIPIFFIEWWTYHLIDKEFKIIESKAIKWWDLHIGNSKIFSINLDVVIFPSYWLKEDFLNEMLWKINYWLFSENKKTILWQDYKKSWKYFYTETEILKEITNSIAILQDNLHKELSQVEEEKYIHQIKNITPKTLVDFYAKTWWKLENIWDQKIITQEFKENIDNNTNRILKSLLNKLKKQLTNEQNIIKVPEIKNKLKSRINRFLKDYLDKVQELPDYELDHKFIYDLHYGKFNKLYNKLFKELIISFNLLNKNDDNYLKSINDIFEIYSYLELKDILDEILKEKSYISNDDFKTCYYNENKKDILKYEHKYDWISDFKEIKYKDKKCYIEYENDKNKIRYIFWDILTHNFQKDKINCDFIDKNNKIKYDFKNILWESFKNTSWKLTPDISIDIYNKKDKKLKKKIIFDSKFSVFKDWDLEYPNPHYFKEELHKYRKIYDKNHSWEFKSFISTIFILYPWNILKEDLEKFKSLNNSIKSSHNMLLIPIYSNQDEKVRDYIKNDLLKNELI